MTIVNVEEPEEKLEFKSPMKSANLKGCHDIQNLGAVETYQRRYLYMNALEIVEHDPLDATTGKDDDTSEDNTDYTITDKNKAKIKELIDNAHSKVGGSYSRKQVEKQAFKDFAKSKGWKSFYISDKTNDSAAKDFIKYMENRLN